MKETEWIINPKQLRENQEKSYLLEKENKKAKRNKIIESFSIGIGSIIFGVILAFMFVA